MNYWIPNFADWNEGFDPSDVPSYVHYDYVEYWEYVPESEWEHDPDCPEGYEYDETIC